MFIHIYNNYNVEEDNNSCICSYCFQIEFRLVFLYVALGTVEQATLVVTLGHLVRNYVQIHMWGKSERATQESNINGIVVVGGRALHVYVCIQTVTFFPHKLHGNKVVLIWKWNRFRVNLWCKYHVSTCSCGMFHLQ